MQPNESVRRHGVTGPGYGANFAERGAGYDDAMTSQPRARDEEFGFVVGLTGVRPSDRVIDIPSGGGYLARYLPAGVDYVAVECSSSFAARGSERGLTVVEGDLDGTFLPARCADVVVSVAGVHHEDDPVALLDSWRRLLRPGGRLVVADVAADSAVASFLDDYVGKHNGIGHVGRYLPPDMERRARDTGYVDVRIVDGAYHWWFPDEEALGRFCIALFGLERVAPSHVIEAARRTLGFDAAPDGGVGLRWGLRAVVASAPEGRAG